MSRLILNKAAVEVQKNVLQKLTFNLESAKTRLDTLEGRQHTVVPMVMLLEGVHAGSGGPLYYPATELGKTPEVWNHKPIVVDHPEKDGFGISACSPHILNNRKVGIILNTKFTKGRLKAEAWLEKDRADVVDDRVFKAITANEMMEISTGVYVDIEPEEGIFNKEAYSGIATNYRPDHLALLPDKIGACSIADGGGLLRNQSGFSNTILNQVAKSLGMTEKPMPQDFLLYKIGRRLGITENEMSFSNVEQTIRALLQKKFPAGENGPWVWVADIYSNFVIYERDGKLFRLGYTTSDTGELSLSDDNPKEVRRVTEYRTVEGTFVGNQDQSQTNNNMDKAKMIVAILAANAGWTEKDKPSLEALSDDQVKSIHNGVTKKDPAPAPMAPAVDPKKKIVDNIISANQGWTEEEREVLMNMSEITLAKILKPGKAAPKEPTANVILPVEDYLKSLPEPVRNMYQDAIDTAASEKAELVDNILKNSKEFTKEELAGMKTIQLRKIAKMANKPTENGFYDYSGQAPVTENQDGDDDVEPMVMPAMNFAKAGK